MAEADGIFVSHAHEDNGWCRTFVEALRQTGASVWYDENNLGYGVLGEEIEREIQARPIFIVILSPASVRKPWVRREIEAAISLRDENSDRTIVLVAAEKAEIPLFWRPFTRVSGPGDGGLSAIEAARQVIQALGIVHAGAGASAATPPARETVEEARTRGEGLIAQHRDEEALSAYEKALALNPQDAVAWAGKGYVLRFLQRYEEALLAYNHALASAPDDAKNWYHKGIVLQQLERYEEALAAYEQALALNPQDATVWYSKGTVFYTLKRYEEALAAYEQALALNPQDAGAWNGKGYAYLGLDRYDDALMSIERALALEPNNVEWWDSQGEVLLKAARSEEALWAYERALTLDPHFASAWNGKIGVLMQLGRVAEAQEVHRQRDEALGPP
ncbi:MAG: tetratricopeptide repeat protein [Ktedonobacterales bacterium]